IVIVRADAPILGARAPGAKRVEIVGNHATLYVAPWTGALAVDAVLEGGKPARASVNAGATGEVTLVPTPQPSAARPSRVGTAGKTTPATPKKNELQDNPY